jgi:hypothetical protein
MTLSFGLAVSGRRLLPLTHPTTAGHAGGHGFLKKRDARWAAAGQLAALRAFQERLRGGEEAAFQRDNPLLAWAERVQAEEKGQRCYPRG